MVSRKQKRVRVVIIDPVNKTLTEQHIEPDPDRYYFWMDCTCIELLVRQVNENEVNTLKQESAKTIRLYVDETGGYTDKPRFILRSKYGTEELIGKSVLIGDFDSKGDETDCPWSLDDVRKFIFFDIQSLRRHVHDNK